MFNNTKAYKMKNITRTNGTDPSVDPKLQLLENLLKDCYNDNITHSHVLPDEYDEHGPKCPRTFDGFSCWDETPATMIAYQNCPEFVVGFDPRRVAFKRCTENGTWYLHPEGKKPWTNYTTCVDVEDLDFRSIVNNIYVYGYSLSVAALFLSIAVFLYYRTLYCTRIRIHMHLFTAFALNNILWIIWYKTVVNDVQVLQDNKEWCQVLHVFTNYFMVTSYFWMFCEGLHLHIALVVLMFRELCSPHGHLSHYYLCISLPVTMRATKLSKRQVFVKEDMAMRCFLIIGWGMSLIVVLAYATTRILTGEIERCWMDHSDSFWIIIAPVVLSLFLSLVFLINVVWVLVMKLYPTPNHRASLAVKKATRAALILIPLFGLHFVLIPLRPAPDTPGEKLYQVLSALLTSLQGLCVAILFCFTNHEVQTAARGHVYRFWPRNNEGIPMTGVTGGESIANTRSRDNVV